MAEVIQIVAMDLNGVIGIDGKIPWDIPKDMQRFRRLTMGHTVIMGRKTFESIGRALPGRANYVLSRDNTQFSIEDAVLPLSYIDESLLSRFSGKVFIIGGEQVYKLTMDLCDTIEWTKVLKECDISGAESVARYPGIPKGFECVEVQEFKDHINYTSKRKEWTTSQV